jgi:D-glycero-D-manno-heptose 1,7-bisphosphate phosphatase
MKLIVLDRDGVINFDSAHYIKNHNEWIALPGSLEAIALLNQSGYRVAIATNQSGISRGIYDVATLNAIHDKMFSALSKLGGRIDAIFYCPHANEDGCSCRKPKPGMMQEIGHRFGVDMRGVPVIGDALRDLQAGVAMGMQPILVRTGKGEQTIAEGGLPEGTLIFDDLASAVQHLLGDNA